MDKMKTAALIAVLSFCFASCGGQDEKLQADSSSSYESKETYFSLPGIDTARVDLARYKGKPLMVVFFAEYCPYCRKAAPFLNEVNAKYSGEGFSVIGIGVEGRATSEKFARENMLEFPVAYNGNPVARKYGTRGVPYIYVLNKNHEVADFWAGYNPSFNSEIEASIRRVLHGEEKNKG